jgi:hypothetical protein
MPKIAVQRIRCRPRSPVPQAPPFPETAHRLRPLVPKISCRPRPPAPRGRPSPEIARPPTFAPAKPRPRSETASHPRNPAPRSCQAIPCGNGHYRPLRKAHRRCGRAGVRCRGSARSPVRHLSSLVTSSSRCRREDDSAKSGFPDSAESPLHSRLGKCAVDHSCKNLPLGKHWSSNDASRRGDPHAADVAKRDRPARGPTPVGHPTCRRSRPLQETLFDLRRNIPVSFSVSTLA